MSQKVNRSKLQGRLVFITHFIPINDYDRLYENVNNLQHFRWQEFIKNEKIKIEYIENFHSVKTTKSKTGYWFFRDRGDRRAVEFEVAGKTYSYTPNACLYTAQPYNIKHKKLEQTFQDRPVIKFKFI